mmetsp:Transcript_27366/g.55063  ORF Transcript_27366/g.55063 Transcript_27366/m.55063 type:complete len:207 (-) Transcript_27366:336-956(-)
MPTSWHLVPFLAFSLWILICTVPQHWLVSGQLDPNATVLPEDDNRTGFDLPDGTVVEMFSDRYCKGDATLIPHDKCLRLGFDEWQGDSLYFKCACRRCASSMCTTDDCIPCGHFISGVTFKPPQSWLPTLHCGFFLRQGCGPEVEFPGEACVTTKMEANRCYNLEDICLGGLQQDPSICESPDIIFQNNGRKPCYKSLRTANFECA